MQQAADPYHTSIMTNKNKKLLAEIEYLLSFITLIYYYNYDLSYNNYFCEII